MVSQRQSGLSVRSQHQDCLKASTSGIELKEDRVDMDWIGLFRAVLPKHFTQDIWQLGCMTACPFVSAD